MRLEALGKARLPEFADMQNIQRINLALEVVILLVGGMALLITGILLFPVTMGALPCYPNGLYGLLLIVFALQMIMLGKTPFGDMPQTRLLLALGLTMAALGTFMCFIPVPTTLPRILLFVCFGPGGFLLLWQMCISSDKFRLWLKYGGIFWHLILACSVVYILSMLLPVAYKLT